MAEQLPPPRVAPVVVTRETTARPEAVAAGAAIPVGFQGDRIREEVVRLQRDPKARAERAVPRVGYRDEKASERFAGDAPRLLQEKSAKC